MSAMISRWPITHHVTFSQGCGSCKHSQFLIYLGISHLPLEMQRQWKCLFIAANRIWWNKDGTRRHAFITITAPDSIWSDTWSLPVSVKMIQMVLAITKNKMAEIWLINTNWSESINNTCMLSVLSHAMSYYVSFLCYLQHALLRNRITPTVCSCPGNRFTRTESWISATPWSHSALERRNITDIKYEVFRETIRC